MSFRTTALLFGIMIGVLWLFGLMLTLQRNKLDPGFVLPTLAKDQGAEIETVEIDREGDKYVFYKEKAGWKLRVGTGQRAVRADEGKVRDIIEEIKRARKVEDADLTSNLARWGLDKPTQTVTLKSKGGSKQWTLRIGKESADRTNLYVSSSDRPDDVMAVRRVKLESVVLKPEDVNKYRARQLLDISDVNARSVDLKPAPSVKGRELILERGKDAVWRFQNPAYGLAEYEGLTDSKDPTGVRGLLNTLGAIRADTDADFEPIGKKPFPDDKAILRVDVKRTAEGRAKDELTTETLLIGPKVEGKEQYLARLLGDESAVRVAARNVDILLEYTRKPDTLRSHDLAQLDANKVDLVKVSSGKGLADVVTLYRPAPNDWTVIATGLRHRADESTIKGDNGLLGAVQGKGKVKGYFDVEDEAKQGQQRDKELGFDAPTAKVMVWTGGLEKEPKKVKDEKKDAKDAKKGETEAKKGDKEAKKADKEAKAPKGEEEPRIDPKAKPALTLTFGKRAGDLVYVKRESADGSVARVSVPVSILDKVTPREGALAFLDHTISPFNRTDVARLELKLPEGKVFVVEREADKKDKDKGKEKFPGLSSGWLLLQPKDFKDRPHADLLAVNNALGGLSRIIVQRWVAKVEDKKALKEYGLDAPSVQAIVTLKKKEGQKEPTTLTYQFGGPAKADKGKPAGVYGIVTGGGDLKDIVFVTPEDEVRGLKETEFRDRTVFNFDPAKVKSVKVAVQEKSFVLDVDFERKGNSWAVKKAPGGFDLDPVRVDDMVLRLSELKAQKYVKFGAPEPAHGLGDNKTNPKATIEILMQDKATYTLKLGNADGTAGYFAQSSTLPGAVFLVPRPDFQGLIDEGVSFFARTKR